MRLTSRPKVDDGDGQRSTTTEGTLRRIEPLTRKAGITRVADITRLDRIGIPVFSSIRPEAGTGAISVYNGKGLTETRPGCRPSWRASNVTAPRLRDDDMERKLIMRAKGALDPRELILPRQDHYALSQPSRGVR